MNDQTASVVTKGDMECTGWSSHTRMDPQIGRVRLKLQRLPLRMVVKPEDGPDGLQLHSIGAAILQRGTCSERFWHQRQGCGRSE